MSIVTFPFTVYGLYLARPRHRYTGPRSSILIARLQLSVVGLSPAASHSVIVSVRKEGRGTWQLCSSKRYARRRFFRRGNRRRKHVLISMHPTFSVTEFLNPLHSEYHRRCVDKPRNRKQQHRHHFGLGCSLSILRFSTLFDTPWIPLLLFHHDFFFPVSIFSPLRVKSTQTNRNPLYATRNR